jgi:hypothetical protein
VFDVHTEPIGLPTVANFLQEGLNDQVPRGLYTKCRHQIEQNARHSIGVKRAGCSQESRPVAGRGCGRQGGLANRSIFQVVDRR